MSNDTMKSEKKQNNMPAYYLAADRLKATLSQMRNSKVIDEEGYNLLWWYYGDITEDKLSWAEAGKRIGVDSSTIYRLMMGKYGAKPDNIIEAIRDYKRKEDHRRKQLDVGFIETSTWRKISTLFTLVHEESEVGFVFGPTQAGKTTAIEEYVRREGSKTAVTIRIPANCSFQALLAVLCKELNISPGESFVNKRARIMAGFDASMILIVDEAHQLFVSNGENTAIKCVEYLRELHDVAGCSVVLVATNILDDEIQRGKLKRLLKQLSERGLNKLRLPDKVPAADVRKIISFFELEPPTGTAKEIVNGLITDHSCGALIKYLKAASKVAAKKDEQLNWEHFIAYHELLTDLASGEYEEEEG